MGYYDKRAQITQIGECLRGLRLRYPISTIATMEANGVVSYTATLLDGGLVRGYCADVTADGSNPREVYVPPAVAQLPGVQFTPPTKPAPHGVPEGVTYKPGGYYSGHINDDGGTITGELKICEGTSEGIRPLMPAEYDSGGIHYHWAWDNAKCAWVPIPYGPTGAAPPAPFVAAPPGYASPAAIRVISGAVLGSKFDTMRLVGGK